MLIGLFALVVSRDGAGRTLELVFCVLVVGAGTVAWFGWQARRRVATAVAPAAGDSLLGFGPSLYAPVGGAAFVGLDVAVASREAALPVRTAVALPDGLRHDQVVGAALAGFVALQAAWDRADRAALGRLTTPAMLEELQPLLDARDGVQRTDVLTLQASLVACESVDGETLASVVFTGLIRDRDDAGAEPFREIWMLARDGAEWKLARQQTLY